MESNTLKIVILILFIRCFSINLTYSSSIVGDNIIVKCHSRNDKYLIKIVPINCISDTCYDEIDDPDRNNLSSIFLNDTTFQTQNIYLYKRSKDKKDGYELINSYILKKDILILSTGADEDYFVSNNGRYFIVVDKFLYNWYIFELMSNGEMSLKETYNMLEISGMTKDEYLKYGIERHFGFQYNKYQLATKVRNNMSIKVRYLNMEKEKFVTKKIKFKLY